MYERDRQTDTHTHRHTPHDGIGRACKASRGKNAYISTELPIYSIGLPSTHPGPVHAI